jgi:hypothetical protein
LAVDFAFGIEASGDEVGKVAILVSVYHAGGDAFAEGGGAIGIGEGEVRADWFRTK